MADQQFCLRWNNHQSTLISVFDNLLENGTLVDCSLAAEGQSLKAHKVVLSACSPYFETLLSQHYEKHPIFILKDVKFSELKSMMDYMYRGEVNISQDQLGTFLKAAESLQIKGLSDNGADGDARDVGSTPKAPPPRKATTPAPPSQPARPDSPLTDGSTSPSSRKRRRVRRSSQDDENNSCDLPQAQSAPVPNIPASITTTPIVKPAIVKPEQTDVNRIDTNSLPPEALKKEIVEPISEPLIEPKTEYLEDVNNEDSVEDLTLDDDDDMDGMDISNMSNMSNMSRPGPSHGNDISNQGFAAWNLGANQSGTDEVFMAAQEAVNQHRDSQDEHRLFTLTPSPQSTGDIEENEGNVNDHTGPSGLIEMNVEATSVEDLTNENNIPSETIPADIGGYFIIHDGKGYYYSICNKYKKIRFLKCIRKKCKCRASMRDEEGAPIFRSKTYNHNHPPDFEIKDKKLLMHSLKERIKAEPHKPSKDILAEEAAQNPKLKNILNSAEKMHNAKTTMRRFRRNFLTDNL